MSSSASMKEPEQGSFRDVVQSLATPSACLGDSGRWRSDICCSVLKTMLGRRWDTHLREAARTESPVLFAYLSDGWGTKMPTQHRHVVGEHVFRREGKVRVEYLCERGILKTFSPTGEIRMAMRMSEPRGMAHGKSGWHIFAACCEYQDMMS